MNIWTIGKNSKKLHYLKIKRFYSHLNMEDITDADYALAKRICKDFEIKKLGEHHDLSVQSGKLFQLMYLRTFETCFLKYMNFILQNLF